MPISVNENGVVKPLGESILYERQLRYIPWHTTYQALTGHDCEVGNVDLFCTVDLSFVPDYVFVKRPRRNAIFFPNDSHDVSYSNWYYDGYSTYYAGFYEIVILTPVHSRHNMSEAEADDGIRFAYDASNQPNSSYAMVDTGFELIDNTVKCYFSILSDMVNYAPMVTKGVGFGYTSPNTTTTTSVLELEVEAFGNCQSIAV